MELYLPYAKDPWGVNIKNHFWSSSEYPPATDPYIQLTLHRIQLLTELLYSSVDDWALVTDKTTFSDQSRTVRYWSVTTNDAGFIMCRHIYSKIGRFAGYMGSCRSFHAVSMRELPVARNFRSDAI